MQRHLVLELLYILYKLQPSRRRIRFALIDSVSLGSFTASKDMLFKMKPSTCTFGRGAFSQKGNTGMGLGWWLCLKVRLAWRSLDDRAQQEPVALLSQQSRGMGRDRLDTDVGFKISCQEVREGANLLQTRRLPPHLLYTFLLQALYSSTQDFWFNHWVQ